MVRVVVATAVLLAPVAGTATARANPSVSRTAWPGDSIGYADLTGSTGYHEAVRRAVAAWNSARLGIRFVPAPPSEASLRILSRQGACLAARAASATSGFQRSGATIVLHSCPYVMRPLLLAHELGRVLGLPNDDRRCSLMNSRGQSDGRSFALPGRCSRWVPPTWIANLVDPASIGTGRAIYAAPAGPVAVTLAPGETPRIGWRLLKHTGAARTLVLRAQTHCPTAQDLLRGSATVLYDKAAYAGLHWAVDGSLPQLAAHYCYSIFTVNGSFRATRRPGRVGFRFIPALVARVTVVSGTTTAGASVAFRDDSTDTAGTITHWHWDFGDPGSGAANVVDAADANDGRATQHVYAQPGSYTVTLSVTDSAGRTATVSQRLVVQ
jgi:hypothetical protein